jgi:hypothetical protein
MQPVDQDLSFLSDASPLGPAGSESEPAAHNPPVVETSENAEIRRLDASRLMPPPITPPVRRPIRLQQVLAHVRDFDWTQSGLLSPIVEESSDLLNSTVEEPSELPTTPNETQGQGSNATAASSGPSSGPVMGLNDGEEQAPSQGDMNPATRRTGTYGLFYDEFSSSILEDSTTMEDVPATARPETRNEDEEKKAD